MAKDDFDVNFDFEEELGFDPKSFLGDTEAHDDIDLNEFTDEELLDLGSLEDAPQEPAPEQTQAEDDFGLDFDFLNMGDPKGGSSPEDPLDVPQFAQRSSYGEDPGEAEDPDGYLEEDDAGEPEQEDAPVFTDEDLDAPQEPAPEPKPRRERRQSPKREKPAKPAMPNIFTKFYDLYFAPLMDKSRLEEPVDPNNPRRRRRKSKVQIFKEVYLPPLVVCVSLVLVLTFLVGSISNTIKRREIEKNAEDSRLTESLSAQQQAEQDQQRLVQEAAALAEVYMYDEAIAKLEEIGDLTAHPDIATIRSEYETIRSGLKEYQDPSLIPNLSFHVLMADAARAYKAEQYGGLYNRNFVSTSEFSKILDSIYNAGYVLVDFNSFTTKNNDQIFQNSIKLPEGKKPIMLTETMVNYYAYMIDSNKDGEPDAGGSGFASKLVLDANGDIKAEYVDGNGSTLTGNYDLVPILEDFIKTHPDFSYRGARAILAVSGMEGIFGYRINTSYIASKSQGYYDAQVAGAKEIVSALRKKGYTLACYTYSDKDYKQMNANQITEDMAGWTKDIVPVIGDVDVFVFAKASNLSDYSGNSFTVLHSSGFRYFIANGTSPWAEVNSTYVRQNRLMVTGNAMAWHTDWFNGIFDPNTVIDMTTRVSVPN